MTSRLKIPAFSQIIFFIVMLDMILGGSGHLMMFGPLSLRYVLFLAIGLMEIFLASKGKIKLHESNIGVFLFLIYLMMNMVGSVFAENSMAYVLDEFTGYLPLMLCLYFYYVFAYGVVRVEQAKQYMLFFCFVLAVVSIGLWLYASIRGESVYQQVEVHFLRRYDIGRLAFAGRLTRLFMKGTVFCVIACLMGFSDLLNGQKSLFSVVNMVCCFLAVLISFTLGLYATLALGGLYIIHQSMRGKNETKVFLMVALVLAAAGAAIVQLGIYDLMTERFSGDYTLSYKVTQTIELLKDWTAHPIFGNGLGHELTVNYGFRRVTGCRFENMWGELINHTGLAGIALYLYMVLGTCKNLSLLSKKTGKLDYSLFALGILVLVAESFSNPFMNNAIGLTYYSICEGMTRCGDKTADNRRRAVRE